MIAKLLPLFGLLIATVACAESVIYQPVTFARGKTTVVRNAAIKPLSIVECGCMASGIAVCNSYVPRMRWRVLAPSRGLVMIETSWAEGNEQIVCRISNSENQQ